MIERDEKFNRIFHNNLVGMILTDHNHIIIDINDHALQLAELERNETIGKTGIDAGIFNEKSLKDLWVLLSVEGKLLSKEIYFISKKSKRKITILVSTEQIELEGSNFWLTTLVDITEKKKADTALSNIYERVTDGFVAIDSNWHYTYVNKRAGELLEKNPKLLVGKHIWTEFPEDIGKPVYDAYHQAMEKQEMISMEEYYKPHDKWFLNLIYPSPEGLSVFFKDITDRVKAAQILEEKELRLRMITETVPVGIFETDADGLTTYLNETLLSYSGMSLDESLGLGWLNGIHPDDRGKIKREFNSKMSNAKSSNSEHRMINKNGDTVWVYGNAVPFLASDGTLTGYIGTVVDFTERKMAMEALQKSEEMLQLSQRITKTGSWEFNFKTNELSLSKEHFKTFEMEGNSSENLLNAFKSKYHPDDREKLDETLKYCLENKVGTNYEHRIICNDGSIKNILGIAQVVLDENGNVESIKGTGQDITESKLNEIQIKESHNKIESLINTIDGIVWEADATTFQFTFISKKVEDILGYPSELWISENQFWADHIHPDDKSWAIDFCVTCTQEKRAHDFEYRMIAKDGSNVWLRDIVTVIVENDKPVQLRGIMIDITANKLSENNLKESRDQLREISVHLENVREEERTKIAREIHDELGQQLTGLKMDIVWLSKKVDNEDPRLKMKFNDTLELVDSAVNSIRRIVAELRPNIIDDLGLNAAIEWHIKEFGEKLGIDVKYLNDFRDDEINSNISIGIYRILQEALSNITKHAKAKKVFIKIETVEKNVSLVVIDDGIGFDTTLKSGHLNFGLMGIKERSKMMNGTCLIQSRLEVGTNIEVKIPIK